MSKKKRNKKVNKEIKNGVIQSKSYEKQVKTEYESIFDDIEITSEESEPETIVSESQTTTTEPPKIDEKKADSFVAESENSDDDLVFIDINSDEESDNGYDDEIKNIDINEEETENNNGEKDSDVLADESGTEEADDNAITISHVNKVYRLYNRGSDRLRESLGLTRKVLSKEKRALNDVSFNVKRGETVGIIGTNGSGKSTILKIITGVLHQTDGEVKVDGRISALLELGAGFNQEYTGLENVYLNGTMMGFTEAEIDEKLPSILEFADIGDYINQPVKTYSSGMFVRLAFAVAINIDPEILIVDEALSVGDVFFQSKCYHKFEEFKKLGKTILFVSHDLSSISKYCDRVVLLNKGEKLGEGSPKEMIDIYKRVLVGQYDAKAPSDENQSGDGVNPNLLEYGDKSAVMEDYYLTDEGGIKTSSIVKGSRFTVHMRVRFNKTISNPIFAFSIKNIKGTEITGTNTMFEKAFLEAVNEGEVKNVTFSQEMNLQGGEYLLSLGVTGFNGDNFEVYHRLYDCINITVVSDKDTVGFYDMNSEIKVENV